jgi:hypothetical protein
MRGLFRMRFFRLSTSKIHTLKITGISVQVYHKCVLHNSTAGSLIASLFISSQSTYITTNFDKILCTLTSCSVFHFRYVRCTLRYKTSTGTGNFTLLELLNLPMIERVQVARATIFSKNNNQPNMECFL